ncbi:MAG: hypothetical protein GX237_01850 [Clostridiales bacterium]|nr:hypothetical protein [Clostridiales bacterium]
MTSKNLFLKLQKEDMKRRVWTISLSMLAFFLLFTVVCAMKVSNFVYELKRVEFEHYSEWAYGQIKYMMSPTNEYLIIITIIGAIICGLSGFFYLHSKKKVDLYHSIAVRREKLFAIVYTNGLLIYIVPYLINLLLCFIILAVNHYFTMELFLLAITTFVHNLLYYILIYTITIIAVMLTGNVVVSFLGTGVFCFYGSFVVAVLEEYFCQFFATYYVSSKIDDLMTALSPIGNYFNTAKYIANGFGSEVITTILLVIAFTLLFIFLAVFLYKKRPSEGTGKAMVFNVSKPIIKLALVIPLSLAGGILFGNIAQSYYTTWLIFGLVFSLIISYGIVEIIYNFDIRKAFSGKPYLLGSAVVVCIIVCVFKFDLFGYDSYIPNKEDIKAVSVAINGIDSHIRYFELQDLNQNRRYVSDQDYQLKHMDMTDFESAYGISEIGIEYTLRNKKARKEANFFYINEVDDEGSKYLYYTIKYTLKRGKEVYREYMIPINKTYDLLQDVYEDLDYKKGHYPIYQLNGDQIKKVSSYNQFQEKEFSLNTDKKNELLEIYREEISKLSLDDVIETQPIATLVFNIDYFDLLYYVYPSFENTISYLNNHGFDASRVAQPKDIMKISVINWDYVKYTEIKNARATESVGTMYTNMDSEGRVTYTDVSFIEEIYSSLVLEDYYSDNSVLFNVENSIDVIVTIQIDDHGNYIENRYYFRAGEVPDFVKRDIGFVD